MSNFLEGARVRFVEEMERLKPQEVARATGISRATIYNWINRGNVPLDKLSLLETAGANTAYILTGQRSDGASAPVLNRKEQTLLAYYRDSSEKGQDAIMQTAFAFAEQKDLKKTG